ncbi:hypothetical protein Syun_019693 [Stephania yunnanensis]|uniref:Uncharacterized protein n=1 Tax=Stephania yunnanensis TaxID=152371 RepID=A0AAP0IUK4_9MAGN
MVAVHSHATAPVKVNSRTYKILSKTRLRGKQTNSQKIIELTLTQWIFLSFAIAMISLLCNDDGGVLRRGRNVEALPCERLTRMTLNAVDTNNPMSGSVNHSLKDAPSCFSGQCTVFMTASKLEPRTSRQRSSYPIISSCILLRTILHPSKSASPSPEAIHRYPQFPSETTSIMTSTCGNQSGSKQ